MLDRITAGRTDLVFDYLAEGHAADASDANGTSLLQWCAYYGDVSALRYLLEKGAALAALGENLDLNGAAFHGHWQLCQFLIEQGADVNQPMPNTGETPLHAATCTPARPAFNLVIELLLTHRADPHAVTTPGVESGCFMRDVRTKGETPLHRAAAYCDAKGIQLLLDAGASLEARDAHGDSPLSWASWHKRPGAVLELLCFGEHRIHPLAVERNQSDHGVGWSGMEGNLRGRPEF